MYAKKSKFSPQLASSLKVSGQSRLKSHTWLDGMLVFLESPQAKEVFGAVVNRNTTLVYLFLQDITKQKFPSMILGYNLMIPKV